MRLSKLSGRKPEVQMAPLIDVVFLLLIFYAVTTQFVTDERLKLELPEAKTAESSVVLEEVKTPIVSVNTAGEIFLDDEIIEMDALEEALRSRITDAEEKSVIIKGDKGADYGAVIGVLDLARSAGATGIQMSAEKTEKQE